MSDEAEPGVPGADEPDAPGTEDEPTPPGMEEAGDTTDAPAATASAAAPQEGAVADGATAAASIAAPSADATATYQYYDQQATAAYPGYGEQYAGYDQYYGYWPGYGDATAATGYDPYAGYYNQDGTTTYAYDPNTYIAPAPSAAPAEAAHTAPATTQATAESLAAAPTVAVPLPAAVATASADATAISDAPAKPVPLSADQTAAAAQEIGAEHAANLLSVDEKQNLEQQQEAAETARKEAEERYQKAEEQRRNAKVKADEQAAKAAADYAQAQAEAQAELHRQLQQRLADAQAAAAAQEAEKEKRRVQPVTLKGARLAFNAPKAPGKPAATPPAGDQVGPRKPDMTIKLDPKPQPPLPKPEPKPDPPAPAKKPGQLYLPQPSTVKNAYLLMAQNKKSSGADKGGGPAPRQASPPRGPPSPARRPSPPRSPSRKPPSPASDEDRNRQRSMQEAARKVKGRGNRRYRPEEGAMTGDPLPPPSLEGGGDRRERDEHRSKHKHHRHHRRHREHDTHEGNPRQISPARFARPLEPAPARYVPPPHDQPPTQPQHPNGARPGQTLFPGAFSSYNPPASRGVPPPQRQQGPNQQSHGFTQGYDRRNDRYGVPQQQSGMRAYPNVSAAAAVQGVPRQPPAQPPAQLSIAAGLPVLSDSSEDEDDLPLPGSTSMRAMSVLQKYLSGAPADSPAAASEAAAAPQAAPPTAAPKGLAMTTAASFMPHSDTQAAILTDPRAGAQGRVLPSRGPPARPFAAPPSGYSSGSDHSQLNGAAGGALHKKAAAAVAAAGAGDGASDDMDMSPIVERETGDSLDSKALAKLPAQLREAAAAAMARHKAEQPKQAVERAIDIPGQLPGRQAQHAKRGQRQYRQRGGDKELEDDFMPVSALPNQAAGVAAVTRMQEQEYEARARAKRARGEEAQEGSEEGRKRSKKHKKHHKKEKRDRSSRRGAPSPDPSAAAPPQPLPQDRRFPQPSQDSFNRRTDYPPQPPRHQQQGQQPGFNRQPGYDQGQGQGFQRKPSFGQDQGFAGRPGGGPDFLQRQRYPPQEGGAGPGGPPPARRRRQFSDRRSPSKSRSRSRSYSRSRSRSYSRSRSRSRLRSRSPRRFNRSVTPPPRRGFGLRADQQGRADGRRPGPAPVHGIPPPGSGPAPPAQPPLQPYGVLPPVSAFPPSSGAFGHMAPNPLAGMFQPLPAAPPANPMLVNQQAAAEKAGKAAKRLYVGNIPFDTTQSQLTSFFDTIMTDTNAVATDTEEQGSAVTSCTLYDRSSAAAGPKAKYAFLNLRSVGETSNCVALDGVYLKANALKVRRPDDYDAKKVADLGPSEPSTSLNSLVLSQLKRPPPPPPEPELPPAPAPAPAPVLLSAEPQGAVPAATGEVEDGEVGGAVAITRVLKLEHMVARDELLDEEEYNDIVDDITEEIETKYGHIQNIAIPRPTSPEDQATSGVGFVFVEFSDAAASVKAQKALHGRMFGENQIDASYYSEDAMTQKQYI